MHFDGAGATTIDTGPGHHQPGEIEQRITDSCQLPIDYRGQLAAVMPEHDVGQVKVAMLNTGLKLLRAMIAQPIGQTCKSRQAARPRPTGVVFDAVQVCQPA
ncbi:hypothetical protein D3C81_1690220 [compost metagenome]